AWPASICRSSLTICSGVYVLVFTDSSFLALSGRLGLSYHVDQLSGSRPIVVRIDQEGGVGGVAVAREPDRVWMCTEEAQDGTKGFCGDHDCSAIPTGGIRGGPGRLPVLSVVAPLRRSGGGGGIAQQLLDTLGVPAYTQPKED